MDTILSPPRVPNPAIGRGDRAAAAAGLLYAALLIAGVALLGTPEGDAPDPVWTDHFADGGNRARVLAGGLSAVGAGIAFLVLAAGLARRLGSALVLCLGAAHGVLVVTAGLFGSSMAIVTDVAGMPLPDDPDLLRLSDALFFATLLLPALLTGGVFAWAAARTGGEQLPAPLRRSGYAVGVLSIAGLALIPVLLWLAWVLAVAVWLGGDPAGGLQGRDA